ncbi:class II fructose-bisphosphate aldolase [Paenibacillus sp. MWE-103]|uniref:Class II fructose-bisphosphate aldolase n=1 Tax=Paenibacillus artemisiicola TaxID=1172618 RepID=A0ABS3WJ40_9BACL|nr:class II fructose-bisphosphate aldolase [Paenibacillus artemisiicola]
MSLVSSTSILRQARLEGYCVPAFNVHTLEMLQAVAEAAEESKSPVILQSTTGTVKHLGATYIAAAAKTAAELVSVPIVLHLDHCSDFDIIARCVRAGYTSVMIDASMHPFEENVRQTRKVVELADAVGINAEAELGKIGGVEDGVSVGEDEAMLADPEECALFVERTGVHTLAPAIGTAHGIYKGGPKIDFDRIGLIAGLTRAPLVLHGGSGIPDDQVRRCIGSGMAKMNIATELRMVFTEAIKAVLDRNPDENDPRQYMKPAKEATKRFVKRKMELCGSAGKAGR